MRIVEKLDINSEFLEIDDKLNYLEFVVCKNPPNVCINVGEPVLFSEQVTSERVFYPIVEVVDKKDDIRYVAIRDKDIFDKILKISDAKLSMIKNERYKLGFHTGFNLGVNKGRDNTVKKIKGLVWWKRLLNKF